MIKHFSTVMAAAALTAFPLTSVLADESPAPATSGGMSHMAMGGHGMPPGGDGSVFSGTPDLAATISLVKLGGGPATFSIAKALTAMVGPALVTDEVTKLTKQYGKPAVDNWITVFDYSVQTAAATATTAGVKFPDANLGGKELAARLVMLGVPGNDGAFYHGTLLDHLVTHPIHETTMAAIDAKFSPALDANYHRITDQAMYDLAQALGATTVKLAAFH
ncbi:MAG: hypothetical protein JWN27_2447 [Candidatus Eremiobacteraeota bacterium]|nr:hypothetical protein [Candidatus Eremiobacteraeota bacterium]